MSGADWVGAGLLLAPAAYAVLMIQLRTQWQAIRKLKIKREELNAGHDLNQQGGEPGFSPASRG